MAGLMTRDMVLEGVTAGAVDLDLGMEMATGFFTGADTALGGGSEPVTAMALDMDMEACLAADIRICR